MIIPLIKAEIAKAIQRPASMGSETKSGQAVGKQFNLVICRLSYIPSGVGSCPTTVVRCHLFKRCYVVDFSLPCTTLKLPDTFNPPFQRFLHASTPA